MVRGYRRQEGKTKTVSEASERHQEGKTKTFSKTSERYLILNSFTLFFPFTLNSWWSTDTLNIENILCYCIITNKFKKVRASIFSRCNTGLFYNFIRKCDCVIYIARVTGIPSIPVTPSMPCMPWLPLRPGGPESPIGHMSPGSP